MTDLIDEALIRCVDCEDEFRPGQSCRCSEPATIAAHQLRPGHQVLIYGRVPVTIIEATCLPAFQPAQTVALTYRRDFAGDTHIVGTLTAQASQTFPVYDDGSPF